VSAEKEPVVRRLDAIVDDFCRRTRFFKEPMTKGRARMFVMQHRQNTRHRNSVLKLKVATNCPDWDTRLQIIGACTQEVIADHEHGHGKAHWQILEELGTFIGMSLEEIRVRPLPIPHLSGENNEAPTTTSAIVIPAIAAGRIHCLRVSLFINTASARYPTPITVTRMRK